MVFEPPPVFTPPPVSLKPCSSCAKRKPLTEFVRDSRNADGYGSVCKLCRKADTQRRREATPVDEARAQRRSTQRRKRQRLEERLAKLKAKRAEIDALVVKLQVQLYDCPWTEED